MATLTFTPDAQGLSPVSITTTDAKALRIVNNCLDFYQRNEEMTNQEKIAAFMDLVKEWSQKTSLKQEERTMETSARSTVAQDPPLW